MISDFILLIISGMLFYQGLLLFHSADPAKTIAASALLWMLNDDRYLAAGCLVVSSVFVAYAILVNSMHRASHILIISPQVVITVVYAASAISAMIRGSYADGYGAPTTFIQYDQIGTLVLAVIHTACITERSLR